MTLNSSSQCHCFFFSPQMIMWTGFCVATSAPHPHASTLLLWFIFLFSFYFPLLLSTSPGSLGLITRQVHFAQEWRQESINQSTISFFSLLSLSLRWGVRGESFTSRLTVWVWFCVLSQDKQLFCVYQRHLALAVQDLLCPFYMLAVVFWCDCRGCNCAYIAQRIIHHIKKKKGLLNFLAFVALLQGILWCLYLYPFFFLLCLSLKKEKPELNLNWKNWFMQWHQLEMGHKPSLSDEDLYFIRPCRPSSP